MSKSLNFVVSIKLDRRSTDVNGNHPIKLRVWNRATKKVKLYSCNKFTDTTLFEKALNQGATVLKYCIQHLNFTFRTIAYNSISLQ